MSNKVSVIVPVYNVEKYLKECLDSLLEQTYKNIEVIMVDDGSEDESGKICDIYASKYSNFMVIHKKHEGAGFARNTGLDHVSGEYVMFLDSDDYIDKNLIHELLENIDYTNADLCKSGFRKVFGSKKVIFEKKHIKENFINSASVRENFIPRIIGSSPEKKDSFEPSCCASLYRTEIIRKHNIKYNSELSLLSEDLLFNLDFSSHANKVSVISTVGYNYRTNLSSQSQSYRKNRFEVCRNLYLYVGNWLNKNYYSKSVRFRLDRMFFLHLKVCIAQENIKFNSPLTCYKNIKNICNDKLVEKVSNEYPLEHLDLKPRGFIFLLKKKMTLLLFILVNFGVIKM